MNRTSLYPDLANFVLVGDVGSGKTALTMALLESSDQVMKTQAVVFHPSHVVDTPGEFTSRPAYYGALLSTISDISTILYLQPANSASFSLPPGLLQVYPGKRVVGVVSKIDLPDANAETACRVMQDHNIPPPYFLTSTATGEGVAALRSFLISLQTPDTKTGANEECAESLGVGDNEC
ncbi:EutP/PduV family microcompartment system protein [Marinobacter sp. 1_MG-2023]|uniref:EutP/PduV family microcompartment system protein n=1 Tax=Marinobacter sp. 1_MG-2023 TaxID=3062627 RepID=UPI0026E18A98|nr:EutP/PduV family microcompartment system protein [Marinobacter sp. 1_MG-2023]MDO6824650.1 EutP/PduV family microcompartment system protein [Marinobacter sp. 1_MG-2023]